MKVAAVVVTYNRKELLRECLEALLNQTSPLDEIIVINNASTDGTAQLLVEQFPQLAGVTLPENRGGAGGFHEGIRLAYEKGHDWIWVMDDDAIPEDGALKKLIESEALRDTTVYALASVVLDKARVICTGHRRLFDRRRGIEHHADIKSYSHEAFDVDTASFVGMFIGRHAVGSVGLPEKDLFIYYDDTEYCLRIRRQGGRIVTVPSSAIVHMTGECGGKRKRDRRASLSWREFYGRRNRLYAYRKHGDLGFRFYVAELISVARSQAGIVLFRKNKLVSTRILWKSLFDGLRGSLGAPLKP